MAPPPRYKQLTIDVPDDAATTPSEWFGPALPQIQSFMNDTVNALDGKLSRAQNFASQKYVWSATTGASVSASFPIAFDCTLSTVPEAIRVGQARALTPGGSFSGAITCANWIVSSGNKVTVNEITGLNANTEYQITLFLE